MLRCKLRRYQWKFNPKIIWHETKQYCPLLRQTTLDVLWVVSNLCWNRIKTTLASCVTDLNLFHSYMSHLQSFKKNKGLFVPERICFFFCFWSSYSLQLGWCQYLLRAHINQIFLTLKVFFWYEMTFIHHFIPALSY